MIWIMVSGIDFYFLTIVVDIGVVERVESVG